MNAVKSSIQSLIHSFHLYDYILFGVSAGLFLLILLLAIVLRHRTVVSLMLILFAFIVIVTGPVAGYLFIHNTLYKTEISELVIKKLEFSEAVLIKGVLNNHGKQPFHSCTIKASAYRGANNMLEELIFPLKPFMKTSIIQNKQLDVNASSDFKLLLEPFTYSKEYNISVKATCL